MKTQSDKQQLGLRIPREVIERLEAYIKKIGISKQAYILNLLYADMESKSKPKDKAT